jgi:hypothetical protein
MADTDSRTRAGHAAEEEAAGRGVPAADLTGAAAEIFEGEFRDAPTADVQAGLDLIEGGTR